MPLIPIASDARKGKPPCGECHIRPGETCDICGAKGRPRPANIGIVGPVDGMNELHPEGSYFRIAAMQDDERHEFLLSRGAVEVLRDELNGALSSPSNKGNNIPDSVLRIGNGLRGG